MTDYQERLKQLITLYEINIKNSISQNKLPELSTLQAAFNKLKFITDNYKNKNVSETELELAKVNLLESVDFTRLQYFVRPSSKDMFDEILKETKDFISSGEIGKVFEEIDNKFSNIKANIEKIERANTENREKERKLKYKTPEKLKTAEEERQKRIGTIEAISTTKTFSNIMSGFIDSFQIGNPELRKYWFAHHGSDGKEHYDPVVYIKKYNENVINALNKLLETKSLLAKETLQNEFKAISAFIANDTSIRDSNELVSLRASLGKMQKSNAQLNKITDIDSEGQDALQNNKDVSGDIDVAIKKISKDLNDTLEKEGKQILKQIQDSKANKKPDVDMLNYNISQIKMPVLDTSYIPSRNALKNRLIVPNNYQEILTNASKQSFAINETANEYMRHVNNLEGTDKAAPLTMIANLSVKNSQNILDTSNYISTKNYKNLDKNDKNYYDRSLEQITQQIKSNIYLIKTFEMLGENPEVVEDVKKINKELVNRQRELRNARDNTDDEKLGNKILSLASGGLGFLNSIAAMIGLGGIFSLYKFLKEIPDSQKQLGQIRYNTAMSQVQVGADINSSYGRAFTDMGRYYYSVSGGNIKIDEPAKYYGTLINSIGGRYGQNQNKNARDMAELSMNLFAMKEANGLDNSAFNPFIKTLYKDSGYDTQETSRAIATVISDAKKSNVPVKVYLQKVGNLISSTYELSMNAEDAMDITSHFTSKGYLIEDTTGFIKKSAQVRINFGKNATQTAYFGGMSGFGGDLFSNMLLGRISVDRFGNNVQDFQQNLGKMMLTKYSMYDDFLGNGDPNMNLFYFGKLLKDDGYDSKEVSMAISMKKEGKIEDLEKFLGGKNDRKLKKKEDLTKAISSANAAIVQQGNQVSQIQKITTDRKEAVLRLAQLWEDTFAPLYNAMAKWLEGFFEFIQEALFKIAKFLKDLANNETIKSIGGFASKHPIIAGVGAVGTMGVLGAGATYGKHLLTSSFLGKARSPFTTSGLLKGGGKLALGGMIVGGIGYLASSVAEGATPENTSSQNAQIEVQESNSPEDKMTSDSSKLASSSQDFLQYAKSGKAKITLQAPGETLVQNEIDNDEVDTTKSLANFGFFGFIAGYKLLHPLLKAYKQANINIKKFIADNRRIRKSNAKIRKELYKIGRTKPPKPPKRSLLSAKIGGMKAKFRHHYNAKMATLFETRDILRAQNIEALKMANIAKEVKGNLKWFGGLSFITSIMGEYADAELGNERPIYERAERVLISTVFETGGSVIGGFIGGLNPLAPGVGAFAGSVAGAQAGARGAEFWKQQLGIGEKLSEATRAWCYSLDNNTDMFGKDMTELIYSDTTLGRDLRKFLELNGIDLEHMTDTQTFIMKQMLDNFSKQHITLQQMMNQIIQYNIQGMGINNPTLLEAEKMLEDNASLAELFAEMVEGTDNEEYKQLYRHISNYYGHPNAGTEDKEYWENEAYQLKQLALENKTELGKRLRNNIKEKMQKQGRWNLKRYRKVKSGSSYAGESGEGEDENNAWGNTDYEIQGSTNAIKTDKDIQQEQLEEYIADSNEIIDEEIQGMSVADWTDIMGRTAYNAKMTPELRSDLLKLAQTKVEAKLNVHASDKELDRNIMFHNRDWDPTYTDHTKLRPETIEMLNAVAAAYMQTHGGEKITLTGAAEKIGADGRPVHQGGQYSHHEGWKADIVAGDMQWVVDWLRQHGYAAGIEDRGSGNEHVDATSSGYDSRESFQPLTKPRGESGKGFSPAPGATPSTSGKWTQEAASLGLGQGKLRTAQIISQKTGIPVDYILAQMIKESGWTDEESGGFYHNYGGLKVGDIGLGLWGKNSKDHTIFASDEQYAEYWARDVIAINDPKFKNRLLAAAAKNDAREYVHVMKEAGYFTAIEESYYETFASVLSTLQKHDITGTTSGLPLAGGYTPQKPKTFKEEMNDAHSFMKKIAFRSYSGRIIDGLYVDPNQKAQSMEERRELARKMNFSPKAYYNQMEEEKSVIQFTDDVLEYTEAAKKEREELKEIQRAKREATKNNIALVIIKGFMKKDHDVDTMMKEIYDTLKTNEWTNDISYTDREPIM